MTETSFRALVLEQAEGRTRASVQTLAPAALPEGDVTVQVRYSSINYKDGLAITGKGKIIRNFPAIPGIDFAGEVVESRSPAYKPGDQVVLTGWGVGERHWGGLAELARVRAEWLVPLPEGLSLHQSMAIGTAGLTAMLCVMALEEHGLRPDREVLVTGASGGVGSVAVALLARLGYKVAASTGRPELHDYLRSLGAGTLVDRESLSKGSERPLESERWGGAVDTVGGTTLATVLKAMGYGTSVAACGMVGGAELNANVFPFILRGVNLLGIDSVMCPTARRTAAWQRLARDLPAEVIESMTSTVGLEEVPSVADAIVRGQVRGRVLVDVTSR